jgi:hypothetical protein
MKINKSKLKVGYVFVGSEGEEEVVVGINKKSGEVFCRFLAEEGNCYKIEKDGCIKV